MKWICDITTLEWSYIIINVISIVGFLFASVSMFAIGGKSILNKVYNILPDLKAYEKDGQQIILNIPGNIIYENLKEETALAIGFFISAFGIFLDIFVETKKMDNVAHLFILIIGLSLIIGVLLHFTTKGIAFLRFVFIIKKIENNKIFPDAYKFYVTDNNPKKGSLSREVRIKNCSWERKVENGNVEDIERE